MLAYFDHDKLKTLTMEIQFSKSFDCIARFLVIWSCYYRVVLHISHLYFFFSHPWSKKDLSIIFKWIILTFMWQNRLKYVIQ